MIVTIDGPAGAGKSTAARMLAQLLDAMHLDMSPGHVFLNGEDITQLIRTSDVTAASGAIASSPVVRKRLADWQRHIAEGRDVVTEGRDQGTLVFPDALCKFF